MRKQNIYFKISIYVVSSIIGAMAGSALSLKDVGAPVSETTAIVSSVGEQIQSNHENDDECLNNRIKKVAGQYGFKSLNKTNWDDFVMAVKVKHLDSFEKEIGVNYFQIITLSGDITRAKRYLSMSRADINQSDITGMTPIAYAARHLDLNTVKALHLNGADISSAIVYIPKFSQRNEVMRKISRYGAQTPLNMAILQNDPVKTPEIIRYLLDNGAEFSYGNDYLFHSLLYGEVMDEFLPDILENTNLQKVAIPNSPYDKGNAVSAIFSGDKTGIAVEYLFEGGLSPEKHEDEYFPVLNAAILNRRNSAEIISQLINAGFDVNKQALSKKNDTRLEWLTPMWYAIHRKDPEIVEILLRNGASVSNKILKNVNRFPKDEKNKYLDLFSKYKGELN